MTPHPIGLSMQPDLRSRRVLYVALFLVALLTRMTSFTGLIDSDDLAYSFFAQLVSQGDYALVGNHLGLRVGLTVPAGILYALFGVSEFVTILLPLLASAACVPLVMALGRRLGTPRSALIAALLMLSFPLHIRYATVLVPETVVDFWMLSAALLYWHARSTGRLLSGVAAGLLFGIGYLTKEVALFVAVAFLLHAALQKHGRLVFAVASGLALVGVAELVTYAVVTGDPLYRAHVVQSSQLLYFAGQMEAARSNWRIFREYPHEMLVPNLEMGLHSLLTLLLALLGLRRLDPAVRSLLLCWAVVPFLYLNFGSASLSTYLPVAAGPRYVAIVYAPLFLIAGTTLDHWMRAPRWRWPIGSALLGLATLGVCCSYLSRSTGYHTDEVGSLRSIARVETSKRARAVAFTGPRASEWSFSLRLLGGRQVSPTSCLSIRPDAGGLPSIAGLVACPPGASVAGRTLEYPLK